MKDKIAESDEICIRRRVQGKGIFVLEESLNSTSVVNSISLLEC